MRKARDSNQRRPHSVKRQGLPESLPTFVQKSYFMLGEKESDVLNQALSKYLPGQFEPILVGGEKLLKPALQLMNIYRLRIDEIKAGRDLSKACRAFSECRDRPPHLGTPLPDSTMA
jgi:hypothetical protein